MDQKSKQLMIFLAGELRSKASVLSKMEEQDFDYYAADGGYLLAKQFDVPLRRVLGDFDSAVKPALDDLLLYPSEKDQTDSELALELALNDGYRSVWMIAPFGGRLDHTVANLCLLETADQKGGVLKLYDGENLAFLLHEGTHTLNSHFRYISFFPWNGPVELSLSEFKYPLDHYILVQEKPIGVSNEPCGSAPTITIHRGTVLCICIENQQEEL